MASDPEIQAVVDAVISAFNADPLLWQSFLERSRLETELAQIESDVRKLIANQDTFNQSHQASMDALIAQIEAKKAEIDALT